MDISSRAVVHAHCHDSPTDIWASSRFLNLSLDRNFTSLLLLTWVSQKIFRSKWHSPVWYLHCMYHALQMALLRRILSLHWSFKPLKFFHFGDTSFPLKQNRKQNHSDFFFFFPCCSYRAKCPPKIAKLPTERGTSSHTWPVTTSATLSTAYTRLESTFQDFFTFLSAC